MNSTLTLSDIRQRVRLRLDDDSFESDVIDRAINDYQKELTSTNAFIFKETSSNVTLAQGSNSVPAPDGCQRVLGVVITSPYQKSLFKKFTDFDNFVELYPAPESLDEAPLQAWTTYGDNIVFSAPADQEYTIKVYYLTPSAELASDDVIDIPDEFAEVLVIGAVVRILQRDDDYDVAQAEQNRLTTMVGSLLRRYGRSQFKGGPSRMMSSFRG